MIPGLEWAILPLLSGFIILILGFVIYRSNPHRTANIILSIMCCCVTGWMWFTGIPYFAPPTNLFLRIFPKINYIAIIFLWATYLHLTSAFMRLKAKNIIIITYTAAIFQSIITVFTDLIIDGSHIYFFGPYPKAGLLHPLHMVYAIGAGYFCLTNLYKGYRNRKNIYSNLEVYQLKFIF